MRFEPIFTLSLKITQFFRNLNLLVDSTRIITYFTGGATLSKELWYGLLLFIPISFVGARIAKKIVDKIPQKKFRAVIAIILFVIGIKFLFFP